MLIFRAHRTTTFEFDVIEVLLGQRKGSHISGVWSAPGGWVDYGELPQEAGIREVREEVGLTHRMENAPRQVWTSASFADGRQFMTTHYASCITDYDGEPTNMEPEKCDGLRWFDIEHLPDMLYPGLDIAIDVAADLCTVQEADARSRQRWLDACKPSLECAE